MRRRRRRRRRKGTDIEQKKTKVDVQARIFEAIDDGSNA